MTMVNAVLVLGLIFISFQVIIYHIISLNSKYQSDV